MPGERRLLVRADVPAEGPGQARLDVDLAVGDGVTAVMGRSGAGKSTLLATIAGLVRPRTGRLVLDGAVLFDDAAPTFVPPHRRRVALVFQSLALFPHLGVWQNVAYGLPSVPGEARRQRKERAVTWLARVHGGHLADRTPSTLSGGEAQRVALARALASEPRLLLLDEPFSALDGTLRRELGEELRDRCAEAGIPALLVTHHDEDARRLGSHRIVLEAGRLVGGALEGGGPATDGGQ